MKVPPKVWAIGGGIAAIAVVGRLAMGCGGSDGFSVAPPQGTAIRLVTTSESTIAISGVAEMTDTLKVESNQILAFTSPPGATQNVELRTQSCVVDAGEGILPTDGVEDALSALHVTMSINRFGEPRSIEPKMTGDFTPAAENVISSQLTSLQATGPLGYTFPAKGRPAKGESWTFPADLTDAVRQSTRDFVTPLEASAEFTFTYVGDTNWKGVAVHHLKRVGKGRIRQKVNVEAMGSAETTTTMSSEGDVYVDASTGLLIYSESTDKAVIDFGALKMNQTTKVTVTGSKAL